MTSNILIIGASRGIGLELVRQSLQDGARVIATARDDAGLQRLRELGAQARRLDVADPASVSALGWQLDGEALDQAWLVAGVLQRADALSPPTQPDFDHVLRTNVLGAMQVLPQVAPAVAAARGQFAFITSAMGHIGSVSGSNAWLYRVSKAALNMAVVSAQPSYPQARFVLLHPGWVRTDMGGPGAPLDAVSSAQGLRATVQRLAAQPTPAQGWACADVPFLNHDGSALQGW